MLGADVDLSVEISSQEVIEAHRERLKQAADRGYAFSQEVVPHDTGTLKSSGFTPEWRGDKLVYGYQGAQAAPMEYGTNPGHRPPTRPLVRWAQRIGKDPGFGWWVATVKIPQEGVDAQPYLRPSGERVRKYLKSHDLDL